MLIVGITGRSGGGKSEVARQYAAAGYPVADGDVLARKVTQQGSPVLAQLAEAFGEDILDEQGGLRRGELAKRAFATQQGNAVLMDITHPPILREALEMAQEAKREGGLLFFIDAAMIVGGIVEPHCDDIIFVDAPDEAALERICTRDGIDQRAAEERLAAQLTREELRAAADYIILNDGSLEQLRHRAAGVLEALLAKAGGSRGR